MCGAHNCRGTLAPKKHEEEITEDVSRKKKTGGHFPGVFRESSLCPPAVVFGSGLGVAYRAGPIPGTGRRCWCWGGGLCQHENKKGHAQRKLSCFAHTRREKGGGRGGMTCVACAREHTQSTRTDSTAAAAASLPLPLSSTMRHAVPGCLSGIEAEGEGPKGDAPKAGEDGQEPPGPEPGGAARDLEAALPDGQGAAGGPDGGGQGRPSRQVLRVRAGTCVAVSCPPLPPPLPLSQPPVSVFSWALFG